MSYDAVHAQRALSKMESAENDLNLIILDVCCDNPLPSNSCSMIRGRGLTD